MRGTTSHDDILLLNGEAIKGILEGRERQLMAAVSSAYIEHHRGNSCVPHSVFVRFPDKLKERMIALPAYLGGDFDIAGIKWVSSFPKNLDRGLSRASAMIILNSLETGRPLVVLEGSLISAARTAASAALAADWLHAQGDIEVLGIIGCGLINLEIVRYLLNTERNIRHVMLFDIQRERSEAFLDLLTQRFAQVSVSVASSSEELMATAAVISMATTAVAPTIADLSICLPGTTLLHISLRDIAADAIIQADNIVDDVDHVFRAETSLHLAERKFGHRRYVRGTLAQVLLGEQPSRADERQLVVFSPFGLGVLDLAIAGLISDEASRASIGLQVPDFFTGT